MKALANFCLALSLLFALTLSTSIESTASAKATLAQSEQISATQADHPQVGSITKTSTRGNIVYLYQPAQATSATKAVASTSNLHIDPGWRGCNALK